MAGFYNLDKQPIKGIPGVLQRFRKATPEEIAEPVAAEPETPEAASAVEQIASAAPPEQEKARAIVQSAAEQPTQVDALKERLADKAKMSHGELIALGLLNTLPALLGGALGGAEAGSAAASAGLSGTQVISDAFKDRKKTAVDADVAAKAAQDKAALQAGELAAKGSEGQKDRDLKLKIAQMELGAKQSVRDDKLTEGEKAVDKDYAKDKNNWESGGRTGFIKNLDSLKEAVKGIKSGGLTGILPDRLTSDAVLQQRQRVNSAIQDSLRPLLGAAFTAEEGERVLKNAFNEAASPEANKESLNALIKRIEKTVEINDAKAKYFRENRSLAGFDANAATPQSTGPQKADHELTEEEIDAEIARLSGAQ